MLNDADFLYRMLEDGDWVSRDTIVAWSQQIRGYGLTVHSRAADLRKRGHIIETRQERNKLGRVDSFYRLTGTLTAAAAKASDPQDSPEAPSLPSGSSVAAAVSVPAESVDTDCRDEAGTLSLFACEIDESAGMRGAYGDAA